MSARQVEYEVTLPVGHTDASGRVHRRASIRKMRGHEEALFYDPLLTPGRLVTELVKGCLIRLGDIDAIMSDLVSQLYSADRNYLIVELRRITLGDQLQASYTCPSCGGETTVVEDLGSLEVRRLTNGSSPQAIAITLEDGYEDRDGAVHREVQVRLPRGADEEFVSRTAEKDPLRARDALILRCIESFGALRRQALESYGIKILRDLTMGDRRLLYQAIEAQTPGVNFRRSIRCAHCNGQFSAVLEASGFFVLG